jgi:hypothetical protein
MTQPTFFGVKVTLPFDTSDRLVEAADFDRLIIFTRMSSTVLVGFAQFAVPGPQNFAQVDPASLSQQMSFVLPAGQELWAGHTQDGLTVTLALLVTKAAVAVN